MDSQTRLPNIFPYLSNTLTTAGHVPHVSLMCWVDLTNLLASLCAVVCINHNTLGNNVLATHWRSCLTSLLTSSRLDDCLNSFKISTCDCPPCRTLWDTRACRGSARSHIAHGVRGHHQDVPCHLLVARNSLKCVVQQFDPRKPTCDVPTMSSPRPPNWTDFRCVHSERKRCQGSSEHHQGHRRSVPRLE